MVFSFCICFTLSCQFPPYSTDIWTFFFLSLVVVNTTPFLFIFLPSSPFLSLRCSLESAKSVYIPTLFSSRPFFFFCTFIFLFTLLLVSFIFFSLSPVFLLSYLSFLLSVHVVFFLSCLHSPFFLPSCMFEASK